MMRNWKNLIITLWIASVSMLCFHSCQKDSIDISVSNDQTETLSTNDVVEGIVRLKLGEDQESQLSISLKSGKLTSNIAELDSILNTIGATAFKRTFPYSGKYEARSQEKGLHLWYDIKYDTTVVSIQNVIEQFESLNGIQITEPIKVIRNELYDLVKFDPQQRKTQLKSALSTDYPFNDPGLSYQWHYDNDGSVTDSKTGADINLFNAWNIQTGNQDVIVAIIDGGISVNHEDLQDNIWIKTAESSGSSNSDDDNNGYIDDVYGYNFVSNTGSISEEDHGTHVAGTISAVNDNDTGVCGIAGGDSSNPGVRLMSCQVFETDMMGNEKSAENFAEAIKYAADNGAVICQNSWGYEDASSLPQSMKEAIDYFIEYAGIDEYGIQTGPMKGGIVIFASGNESVSTNAYPAMYSPVVSVAAMGADYTAASYTNYGSWVNITAPGGDDTDDIAYDNWVVSTITNNEYAYMIGTSMACPHVSGVAALIVSEYGDTGFTPDMLKEKLYQGAISLDSYNTNYSGMLGVGLINAAASLKNAATNIAPEAVTDLLIEGSSNQINLSWTIPEDKDDTKPSGYTVYYSTNSFSIEDVDTGNSGISSIKIAGGIENVGETSSYILDDLQYSSTYYLRIAAYDVIGSYSTISEELQANTEENQVPLIEVENNQFELKAHETIDVSVTISDPDNDALTWTFTDESENCSATETDGILTITINALYADAGDYQAVLLVEDEYGASSEWTLYYSVLENHVPFVSTEIDHIYIGDPEKNYQLNLKDYFEDEDGEVLQYELSIDGTSVDVDISDQTLTISPQSNGLSNISITAYDARRTSTSASFNVMVRDDEQALDIYPNPVSDMVYFRMGDNVDGLLSVQIVNSLGVVKVNTETDISTFSPAALNLSHLSSGEYLVKLKYKDQSFERNIVKL